VTDEQARQEMIDVGVEPLEPYPGDVHAPWRCRCLTCGTPVTPSRANALRQHPCKHCSKTAAGVKIRVCSVEEASRILVEAGLESREPYPGTVLAPWSIGCRTCSWRGIVQLHYLRQGNRPVCRCVPARPSGFDGGRSALLYVLHHDEHDAGKIGVTNEGTLRLNQHRTAGWIVVATTSFDEGWKAVAVESAVLRQLRGEGSAPFLAAGAMPYGGHTETFDLRRRSVASVQAMIGIEIARVGSPSHTIRPLYVRGQSQSTTTL
jgi:hypothetical protein